MILTKLQSDWIEPKLFNSSFTLFLQSDTWRLWESMDNRKRPLKNRLVLEHKLGQSVNF